MGCGKDQDEAEQSGELLHNGSATPDEIYSSRAKPLNTRRPKSYFYMAHI